MYPESMKESIKKLELTRPKRIRLQREGAKIFPDMSAEEREEVLSKFHPDYQDDARKTLRVGVNKDEKLTTKVVDVLESYSRISSTAFDLAQPDYETDVLVIGGGSAGCAASLMAAENGANVILLTKLRLGDSNSVMAQGGIQAATKDFDSPMLHYLDVIGGGHFDNIPELVKALVLDGPDVIDWLVNMGVMFDKDKEGSLTVKPGGGTCRPRMHSARDYTGAAIISVLRDEVLNRPDKIKLIEYSPAVEIILDDEGKCAGAVIYHLENKDYHIIKAKSTVIATGGYGRLHIKDFATTNHYGATADGLVIAYRAGAKLLYMDSVQYHPTGAVYPEQIVGFLCTEKIRGMGGQPVNKEGELFVFPLEPRDVESASFIRECQERALGIRTPTGRLGVWLDTPIIEAINGEGTIKKNLPAMHRQFKRFGIDMTKEPILVYPTLHYQNGGIAINDRCETNIPGLYVAGEASGGVHGRNRLMGNSQLDINVFGRRAGIYSSDYAKKARIGKLTLSHIDKYETEVAELQVPVSKISPILLPDYIPKSVKEKQRKPKDPGLIV